MARPCVEAKNKKNTGIRYLVALEKNGTFREDYSNKSKIFERRGGNVLVQGIYTLYSSILVAKCYSYLLV